MYTFHYLHRNEISKLRYEDSGDAINEIVHIDDYIVGEKLGSGDALKMACDPNNQEDLKLIPFGGNVFISHV